MKRIYLFLAVALSCLLLVACTRSPEKVVVSPDNIQLSEKGATALLSARALDKTGAALDGVTITWTSTDSSVATVENGKVTAVGSGKVTISAKTKELSADVAVTVSIPTKLSLDKAELALTPDTPSYTLEATILDEKGKKWLGQPRLKWSSADTEVATVDESGKVTAVGAGTTTITVTHKDLKAEVKVESSVQATDN